MKYACWYKWGLLLLLLAVVVNADENLGGDFQLTTQEGETFNLQSTRGNVVVMLFGYTHCPGICPDSLAKVTRAVQQLGSAADDIALLLITVDPERDTPARLKTYLKAYAVPWIGLTGTLPTIQAVADAYHVPMKKVVMPNQGEHYMMDHKADLFVLNRQGTIETLIPYGLPTEHIVKVLTATLTQASAADTARVEHSENAMPRTDAAKATFTDLQLQTQSLVAYKNKPLIINFWASWCPPCRAELPSLNQVWQQLEAEGINMLAINVGEEPTAVSAFLKDYPIDFPVWLDVRGDSMLQWQMQGLPTTLLINADGSIHTRIVGERDWTQPALLEQLRALKNVP